MQKVGITWLCRNNILHKSSFNVTLVQQLLVGYQKDKKYKTYSSLYELSSFIFISSSLSSSSLFS